MPTSERSIVVGIDESLDSEAALRWAIDEARERDLRVELVHAYGWPPTRSMWAGYSTVPGVSLARVRQEAERVLSNALRQARSVAGNVEISTQAVDELPVIELVERSKGAELLVLGSRQLGVLRSFLLGSVGTAVAARAQCPVVVTRGSNGPPRRDGSVVVGIEGSDLDEQAIQFAMDEASRRQVSLRAVLCWHQRYGSSDWILEGVLHYGRQRADAHLSEALAGWREKHPEVEVIPDAIEEHPVPGLLASSAHAQLLVVGRRGTRALPDTVLGSVSQGVLHHAQVPVAVVPTATVS